MARGIVIGFVAAVLLLGLLFVVIFVVVAR
jgi:hypothetical protein